MQTAITTSRFFPEGWITPSDIAAAWRGGMDALYASFPALESLGDFALLLGATALLALPLSWALTRLNRVSS